MKNFNDLLNIKEQNLKGQDMLENSAYKKLERIFTRITNLEDAELYLRWDRATMMPAGGARRRAEQTAEIQLVINEILARPEVGEMIVEAEAYSDKLDLWEKANLREMRRLYMHSAAVPLDLVTAFSKACSNSESVWYTARKTGSYADILPYFKEVVTLVKEIATCKSEMFKLPLFDVLHDEMEPGGSTKSLDPIFSDLENFLPNFILSVQEKQQRQYKGEKPKRPKGPFPVEIQKALGMKLMEIVGFDFNHGRVDPVMHPFCGGASEDLRVTTHYDENDFAKNITALMHETGHALYKFYLPEKWRTQPVGRARGQGIHECQALMLERFIVYSKEFLEFATPLFKDYFGADNSPEWDIDNLYRAYTWVEPSYIRIGADEVTYPAHIILRYRLERNLIEGTMDVSDLPLAFNEGMKKLLGIVPRNDREGCMQDIHWYDGNFGYFPTYTLGAINAAQIFKAIKFEYPDLMEQIKNGNFATLVNWLREKIHYRASLISRDELMQEVTGEPLNPIHYKEYLKHRYLD